VDLDPLGAQAVVAATGEASRFSEGDENPAQTGLDHRIDAGWCLAVM
jgi:hypothetical protein